MATKDTAGLVAGPGGTNLLPRNVSAEIWQTATAQSIIPSLASSTPMILGENVFPTVTKRPAASIVGEGGLKPDSDIQMGAKVVKPIKAVVGLEFTMESVLTNPAGVLGLLQTELSGAIARQIDLAVLHNRQASNGAVLTSGHEYVNQTTNRIELTTGANADAELWAGYGLVVNGANGNDFSGFALDPRFVYSLATARGADGKRLNPEIQMGSAVTTYAGQNVAVSKTVSGQVDASTDTKVRGFGGDWDALKFGYALDMFTKKIEYGDPFGNGDLQRRNSVAYLTEVIFGWAILDKSAFVAYEDAV
ncbi:phage major capsid protein [Arthrobacter frigidicola]|nr:phage major capsid protein [Arthrobacter frigidicola]